MASASTKLVSRKHNFNIEEHGTWQTPTYQHTTIQIKVNAHMHLYQQKLFFTSYIRAMATPMVDHDLKDHVAMLATDYDDIPQTAAATSVVLYRTFSVL